MANALTKKIIADGYRNAIVKLTGVLDTSNVNETPAIALSDFVNNSGTLSGFSIDRLEYTIGDGLEIQISWHSNTPEMIVALAGRGRIDNWHYGGWTPDTALAGYTGEIDLTTTGFGLQAPGTQNFSILLEMVKHYKP